MKRTVLKRALLTLMFVMLLLPVCGTNTFAKAILTGNKKVDLAAEYIIDRCSTKNMTNQQKLKKCYTFLVKKMTYTHGKGHVRIKLSKAQKKKYSAALKELKANGVSYSSKFKGRYRHLLTLSGTCYDMSVVMCILANHLGYKAGLVHGRYVRSSGSSISHWWNYIIVDGKKYYCDVQAANASNKKHMYNYYLKTKKSKVWRKHHR